MCVKGSGIHNIGGIWANAEEADMGGYIEVDIGGLVESVGGVIVGLNRRASRRSRRRPSWAC